MNIANSLTLFRLFLVPVFVAFFYLPYTWSYFASALVFIVAALTDWLDGYFARKLNQATPFGAFLDPVADKIMVAVVLVLMIERYDTPLFAIPAAVIVARELLISALREWMAEVGKRASIAVSYIGKIKTTMQMAAIIVLLAVIPQEVARFIDKPTGEMVGFICLYIAAFLTIWSAALYLKAAWPMLKAGMVVPTAENDTKDSPESTKQVD